MQTTLNQRWKDRRGSYRPAGEVIDTARFEVAPIASDAEAKQFVCEHHYSASYPAARFRFGLYHGGDLVGVAVFSVPANYRTLSSCLPGDPKASVELGRFVLLDEVPGNGETWFLARCFEALRREALVGVVSFSDPVPRTTADGGAVFLGHVGTIYQASNAVYLGRSKAATRRLLPDGTIMHERALTKIRHRRRGWRYSAQILVDHGADELGAGEDAKAWVTRWTDALCRPLKHGGNHKYAWALNRRDRRHLPEGQSYPKFVNDDAMVCASMSARLLGGAA